MQLILSPKRERLILFILALMQFTNIMDFMIMMPLGPQLMRKFAINPQQFSLLVSAYTITAGVSGFVSSFFIDRFGRKKAVLFVYLGFLLGTLLCGLAPSYTFLLFIRSFTGVFGGIMGALVLSIVGDMVPNERRASAMGIIMTGFAMASVFGVPIGLQLGTIWSWHAPFLALAGFGVIIWAGLMFVLPKLDEHLKTVKTEKKHVLYYILQNSSQKKALLLTITVTFGHFSIIPFISPSLVSNAGYSESNLMWVYLVGGIVSFISSPLIGKLADKVGRYPVFAGFSAMAIVPIWLISNMQIWPMYIILTIAGLFFMSSGGRFIPSQTMITSTVTPQHRGGFMSINSSVQQLSSGLASLIGGFLVYKDAAGHLMGYPIVGYIAIIFTIVTLWVARGLKVVS